MILIISDANALKGGMILESNLSLTSTHVNHTSTSDRVKLFSYSSLTECITYGNSGAYENICYEVSLMRNPRIALFATKDTELPYRGIGTGIRRALSITPDLELESDPSLNLFTARIPRHIDVQQNR